MHIDPKGTIGGFPALLVRRALRQLRGPTPWDVADLKVATGLTADEAAALQKLLRAEGLIQATGHGTWEINQAGQTLSSASAGRPVTRTTAERALAQFMDRTARVNRDPYFLAKANRVVLFGSMLRPNVERLSDVDLAVELVEKETDSDQARVRNEQRVEGLATQGRHFRGILEVAACWYLPDQATRTRQEAHVPPIVSMSSAGYSSIGLVATRARLHRRPQNNMHLGKHLRKGDISTLLRWEHFYFALTQNLAMIDRRRVWWIDYSPSEKGG